ncbi:MAG: ABC transporter ATP-binding protein [Clostridiales bacterium]
MSHHKIEVKNLFYKYPDNHIAIDKISFSAFHGESVGIIGANGAGKSTLLMLLNGLFFPVEGKVLIGDVEITKKTLPFIRQRLGMVFQDPDDQLFMPTVYDDVAFGPRNYKLSEAEVESRVNKALDTVGIKHLINRATFKLSGGEKRSASIATVLSMEPDILIMDEPTSSLDPKARRLLIDMLKSFTHTKIITSHDLDMVYEVCDRIIILKKGKIEADGKSKNILSNSILLKSCSLELPLSLQNCPKCDSPKGYPKNKL